MSNEKKEFSTALIQVNNTYLPMIERQLENSNLQLSPYQKSCVLNAIGAINQLLDTNGITWNDKQLDQSNITQILFNAASLQLNAVAEPRECYFQLRSFPVKDSSGNIVTWKKKIEMGIEGDGNDAILANFGRNVKKVYPHWLVREDDKFEYPQYDGVSMTAPKWTPTGTGKVVRVVYPILHDDDTIHYYISEREDVIKNLLAHINNNLQNETFGIVKDRKNATPQQLSQINAKKKEIKDKASKMGLSAIDDEELSKYISPSWREDFSREEMIIRKMRNNITKKIPKDFGSSAIQESYMEVMDENYRNAKETIVNGTATVVIESDETTEDIPETKATPTNADDVENSVKPDFT